MSEEKHDRTWALRRRAEEVSKVRFWFYLWYVVGEGPEYLLELLGKTDAEIWSQWRDLKEINELLDQEQYQPGNFWPGYLDVAEGMVAPYKNLGPWFKAPERIERS